MAIIRCPYCHAIIDENDKYCNNCGTQLLFPEDESVEEEIPGEKILEAEPDDEEKDYEVEEPDKETAELSDTEKETKDVTEKSGTGPWGGTEPAEKGELLEEDAAENEEDEEETEEVILVDEIAAEEAAAAKDKDSGEDKAPPEEPAGGHAAEAPRAPAPAPEEETRAYEVAPAEDEEAADEIIEPAAAVTPSPQASAAESHEEQGAGPAEESPEEETPETVEVETEEEVRTGEIPDEEREEPSTPPPAARPVTFDTRELEGIGPTVELGKERLDKLMEVMAEKQKESETPAEEAPKAEPVKRTGTLPPWADKIRSSASGVESGAAEEAGESATGAGAEFGEGEEAPAGSAEAAEDTTEEEIFPHRKASDSGIGLPERLTQAALPFGPPAVEEGEGEEAEEEEAPARGPLTGLTAPQPKEGPLPSLREETGAENELEEEARPPFHLSLFLKAKAFDILFVGVFWLVALWVAARSMGATLFELLSVTSGSVLLLYAVYIFLYFFLFKFFLGETLGDRLFRERE